MKKGFTLVETLLIMGIIGVIAAMLIPALNNGIQEMEYKTAYKKAYSDISQAFAQAIYDQSLTPRTALFDVVAADSEWNVLKSAFKVAKECTTAQLYDCWVNADKVCTGTCAGNCPYSSYSFIDASGRSWAQYYYKMNIYLVDTNGFKPPNQFGKDRWMFVLQNSDGTTTVTGLPVKVGIYVEDQTGASVWCTYPPCYYKSWLYN